MSPSTDLANLTASAKRVLLTQILRKRMGKGALSVDQLALNVTALERDTLLDPSIVVDGRIEGPTDDPRHILLTGATGFLGAFLLRQLLDRTAATMHCLVRAGSVEEGHRRLQEALHSYGLWQADLRSRIVPVPGDLGATALGLSAAQLSELARTIDVIYHNAALVNWIFPYERLKPINVLGTQDILRLATRDRLKPVHYVSSLGVFPLLGRPDGHVIREDDSLDHNGSLHGGYVQSKWVADKLVTEARSRGVLLSTYRPGLIVGHSETGAWNTADVVSRMLKSWVDLGGAPEFTADETDMTPVNYISDAIVHLSMQKGSLGRTFHLANPQRVHLARVVEWMRQFGYPLRSVPFDAWVAELLTRPGSSREDVVSSLVPLFSLSLARGGANVLKALPAFDCRNTEAGLRDSRIKCASIDGRVLENYFAHFISRGFVKPPRSIGTT